MSLIINAIAGGVIGVLINYLADVLPTTTTINQTRM